MDAAVEEKEVECSLHRLVSFRKTFLRPAPYRLLLRWLDPTASYKGDDSPEDQENDAERTDLQREIATTPAKSLRVLVKLQIADEVEHFTEEAWDWDDPLVWPKLVAPAFGDLQRLSAEEISLSADRRRAAT